MLENLPHAIGHLLKGVRPGLEKTAYHDPRLAAVQPSIRVASPTFADGAALPVRFTEDGEGVSPPLAWTGVPLGASAVAIVVEDADSPTPAPLVHLIVYPLPGDDGRLPEGAVSTIPAAVPLGPNSFMKNAWLPCDPPPGHGAHRYVFQVFALDAAPDIGKHPGRGAVVDALARHAMAKGVLIGTYERA